MMRARDLDQRQCHTLTAPSWARGIVLWPHPGHRGPTATVGKGLAMSLSRPQVQRVLQQQKVHERVQGESGSHNGINRSEKFMYTKQHCLYEDHFLQSRKGLALRNKYVPPQKPCC